MDYLGSAAPHGRYWLAFYAAFVAFVIPMRVLIVWLFVRTRSVLLTQVMHASSTASIVTLAPLHVTAGQEAAWYALCGAALWIVVAVVTALSSTMRSHTIIYRL